jgi:hypothetical protein
MHHHMDTALTAQRRLRAGIFASMGCVALGAAPAAAQDNYEIQVYGSELVPHGATMLELHSNYTFSGSRNSANRVRPSERALHETLEITHGFTDWLEVGVYVFTSAQSGTGWQWVGDQYYGAFGPIADFPPIEEGEQQLVPAIDLDLGADWEFNFGVGVGLTPATDRLLPKVILGRRLGRPAHGTDP